MAFYALLLLTLSYVVNLPVVWCDWRLWVVMFVVCMIQMAFRAASKND